MTRYTKGRRLEYRTIEILEAAGYHCIRSAASKGVFDIWAMNRNGIRLISVKSGSSRLSPAEREVIETFDCAPPNATKEWWQYKDGIKMPFITVIR